MNEEKKEQSISEHIELLTQLMKVSSSVKENVTSDYTLAYLKKEEREYIAENYQNAEYAKELIKKFSNKGYTYHFDEKKGDWERNEDGSVKKIYLTDLEKEKLNKISDKLFSFFMVSAHMIAILNRNKTDNFLVKLLGNGKEEEEQVVYNSEDRNVLQKIKDKMTGEERYEEE